VYGKSRHGLQGHIKLTDFSRYFMLNLRSCTDCL